MPKSFALSAVITILSFLLVACSTNANPSTTAAPSVIEEPTPQPEPTETPPVIEAPTSQPNQPQRHPRLKNRHLNQSQPRLLSQAPTGPSLILGVILCLRLLVTTTGNRSCSSRPGQ